MAERDNIHMTMKHQVLSFICLQFISSSHKKKEDRGEGDGEEKNTIKIKQPPWLYRGGGRRRWRLINNNLTPIIGGGKGGKWEEQ